MFADNKKISWLQADRQFGLAFLGPAVLWITAELKGRNGICSILLGTLILGIWMFFLLRQVYIYRYPERYWGKYMSRGIGWIYQSYLILTGGFLVAKVSELLTVYLIQGVPVWIAAGFLTVTALGAGQDIEARGRFAQAAWPMVAGLTGGLFLLAALQGQPKLLLADSSSQRGWTLEDMREILRGTGWFLSAFGGAGLLPFLVIRVERGAGHRRSLFRMVGKMGLWLGAIVLILQGAFGNHGMDNLKYPVMDLMSGVKFPGSFLQRVDLIFLAVVLFSMVFALGSVFFYSSYIGERMHGRKGRILAAALSFLLGTWDAGSWRLTEEYGKLMMWIFLPIFLTLLVCTGMIRRKGYEKKTE